MVIELLVRQPTMRRANTSTTKATYSQPCQVDTYVKSETHSWLGRCALNCRFTRSSGHGALASLTVVRSSTNWRRGCGEVGLDRGALAARNAPRLGCACLRRRTARRERAAAQVTRGGGLSSVAFAQQGPQAGLVLGQCLFEQLALLGGCGLGPGAEPPGVQAC